MEVEGTYYIKSECQLLDFVALKKYARHVFCWTRRKRQW